MQPSYLNEKSINSTTQGAAIMLAQFLEPLGIPAPQTLGELDSAIDLLVHAKSALPNSSLVDGALREAGSILCDLQSPLHCAVA